MHLHDLLVVPDTDDCVDWPLAKTSFGHGACCLQRGLAITLSLPRVINAHRASYLQNVGAIPEGLVVRHMCHRPSCINPRHLRVGTQKDNIWDSIKDGRIQIKLTEETAWAIKQSTGSQRKVAKEFGVSPTVVWHIRNGNKWSHANGPTSTIQETPTN